MSNSSSARARAWLASGVLLTVTLLLTLSRAWRWPNDFAEAHWLLDYRFGFVKRGLAGQVFTSVRNTLHAEPSAAIISAISIGLLAILAIAMLWTAWQVVRASARHEAALLVSVAFLSSPFIVMSAHLIGYLDGILILLTVTAVALTLGGRLWAAGVTQAVAVLVHESAVLVGLPILCLAWWVAGGQTGERRQYFRRAIPLALPVIAFAALSLSTSRLHPDFQDLYSLHLQRYAFIEGDMHLLVPEWLTPGFAEHVTAQKHRFAERITAPQMLGLILPTVVALLAWTIDACRVRTRSLTLALLLGATFAPQLMHMAAWDTMRIWTYSVAMAWLGAWTVARGMGAPGEVSTGVRGLAFLALVVNVMATTYLLDYLTDRYTLTTRLMLFGPVLAAALYLFLRPERD